MIANNLLYSYVFWHNGYINKWYAIPRSEQVDFFSGNIKHDSFMSAKSFNKLIEMVAESESTKISETSEQNPDVEKIVLCDNCACGFTSGFGDDDFKCASCL